MSSVDFTHPNKFLASLGVGLIAASVALPWMVAQSLSSLTIKNEDLSRYPLEAQETILERIAAIRSLQHHLPWIMTTLIAVGLVTLAVGLVRWMRLQKPKDDVERMMAQESLAPSSSIPSDDIEKERRAEATETLAPAPDTENPPSRIPPLTRPDAIRERADHIRASEERVTQRVRAAYESVFQVATQQRMESGARVDILLNPPEQSNFAQIAIDVSVISYPNVSIELGLLRLAVASLDLREGCVYTGSRGKPPVARSRGLRVLVLRAPQPDEGARYDPARVRAIAQEKLARINEVLRNPLCQVVVDEDELETMTARELHTLISKELSRRL